MDEALEVADWYGFETRRKAETEEGSYDGIGVACFVEPAGGWRSQRDDLRFHPDGKLTAFVGAQSTGMGHETSLAKIVPDGVHLTPESVRMLEGEIGRAPGRAS